MIELDADLKVLARVKHAGQVYELKELSVDQLLEFKDVTEGDNEAIYKLFSKAGIPEATSKNFSIGTLKKLEKLLVGEFSEKK